MIKGKIEFTGKTMADVEAAVEEALARINLGNTSGFDRNQDGSFSFEADHDADGASKTSE